MTSRAANWFETKYIGGVIHKLQSAGFVLKSAINSSGTIRGNIATWKIAGTGIATERSAAIEDRPTMNADRTTVTATMKDYEANDWINTTDLDKMPENEQQVAMKTGAMALGRKFDSLVLAQMDADVTVTQGDGTTAISPLDLLDGQALIKDNGVNDYEFFAAIPVKWMSQLEVYREFSSSDFIGDEYPLLKQLGSRRWKSITVIPMPSSFFNVPSANKADGFLWAKECTGFAATYEGMRSRADYVPEKKAYYVANDMSAAPKILLPEGLVRLRFATNIATTRPSP